jgi:hypothetical protein
MRTPTTTIAQMGPVETHRHAGGDAGCKKAQTAGGSDLSGKSAHGFNRLEPVPHIDLASPRQARLDPLRWRPARCRTLRDSDSSQMQSRCCRRPSRWSWKLSQILLSRRSSIWMRQLWCEAGSCCSGMRPLLSDRIRRWAWFPPWESGTGHFGSPNVCHWRAAGSGSPQP